MSSTGVSVADLGLPGGTGAPADRRPGRRDAGAATPSAPPPALVAAGRVAGRVGGPALAVTYLSLLVLLPLAALDHQGLQRRLEPRSGAPSPNPRPSPRSS